MTIVGQRRPSALHAGGPALVFFAASLAACGAADAPAGPSAAGSAPFRLTSTAAVDGGTLPQDFTCDGAGATLPLAWENAPAATREFALLMSTLPGDGTTKWNWVVYAIPETVTSFVRDARGPWTLGVGSDGPQAAYQPPCSQGPGPKVYTFTIYALTASPRWPAGRIDGAAVLSAVAPVTAASASLSVTYTRPR